MSLLLFVWALLLLTPLAPGRLAVVTRGLEASDQAALMRERLITELALQLPSPAVGRSLARFLTEAPPPARAARLAALDACRRVAGLPAAIAYVLSISDTNLVAERDAMLRYVLNEGGFGSRMVLEMLWERTTDASVRAAAGGAIGWFERMGEEPAKGRVCEGTAARVGRPDGSASWLLLVRHPERFGFTIQIDLPLGGGVVCRGVFVMPGDPQLVVSGGEPSRPEDGERLLTQAASELRDAVRTAPNQHRHAWELLVALCLLDGLPERAVEASPSSGASS